METTQEQLDAYNDWVEHVVLVSSGQRGRLADTLDGIADQVRNATSLREYYDALDAVGLIGRGCVRGDYTIGEEEN